MEGSETGRHKGGRPVNGGKKKRKGRGSVKKKRGIEKKTYFRIGNRHRKRRCCIGEQSGAPSNFEKKGERMGTLERTGKDGEIPLL